MQSTAASRMSMALCTIPSLMVACCATHEEPTGPSSIVGQAEPRPVRPPSGADARALLHEAMQVLSTSALRRESVDWTAVEASLSDSLRSDDPPNAAYPAIRAAMARLNDPHNRFEPAARPSTPGAAPTATSVPSAAEETASSGGVAAEPSHPPIPRFPEAMLLSDGVGYVIVPGCGAPDAAGLREFARRLAAELDRVGAESPKAWLIDLRLNGGGNLWPMLLGFERLLGDGPLMTMVTEDGVVSTLGVSPGAAWIDWGKGPESQLDWAGSLVSSPPPPAPGAPARIAVLLGPWTMSSGEALAICLAALNEERPGERGPEARSFGEPTAGLTTVTNGFRLFDGSVLILAVSEMGDVHGRAVRGELVPDHRVTFEDWPGPEDAAALAARRWALRLDGR